MLDLMSQAFVLRAAMAVYFSSLKKFLIASTR